MQTICLNFPDTHIKSKLNQKMPQQYSKSPQQTFCLAHNNVEYLISTWLWSFLEVLRLLALTSTICRFQGNLCQHKIRTSRSLIIPDIPICLSGYW